MTDTQQIPFLRFIHYNIRFDSDGFLLDWKARIGFQELIDFYYYIIKNYEGDPEGDLSLWYRDGKGFDVVDIFINEFKNK